MRKLTAALLPTSPSEATTCATALPAMPHKTLSLYKSFKVWSSVAAMAFKMAACFLRYLRNVDKLFRYQRESEKHININLVSSSLHLSPKIVVLPIAVVSCTAERYTCFENCGLWLLASRTVMRTFVVDWPTPSLA